MKELVIVPFNKDLLYDFVYNGVEKDISGEDIKEIAAYYSTLGYSFIGYINEKAVGVGGVFPLWKRWGSCWLFLNKEARNYKISIFKCIVEKLHELVKAYSIEILTVQCLDESMEAHRLLNHLGFIKSKEFRMTLYGKKITPNGKKI